MSPGSAGPTGGNRGALAGLAVRAPYVRGYEDGASLLFFFAL